MESIFEASGKTIEEARAAGCRVCEQDFWKPILPPLSGIHLFGPDPKKFGFRFFDKLTLTKGNGPFYWIEFKNSVTSKGQKNVITTKDNPLYGGWISSGQGAPNWVFEFAFIPYGNLVALVVSKLEWRGKVMLTNQYARDLYGTGLIVLDSAEAQRVEGALRGLSETAEGKVTQWPKNSIIIFKPASDRELLERAERVLFGMGWQEPKIIPPPEEK